MRRPGLSGKRLGKSRLGAPQLAGKNRISRRGAEANSLGLTRRNM
jgi:hypothetical protein